MSSLARAGETHTSDSSYLLLSSHTQLPHHAPHPDDRHHKDEKQNKETPHFLASSAVVAPETSDVIPAAGRVDEPSRLAGRPATGQSPLPRTTTAPRIPTSSTTHQEAPPTATSGNTETEDGNDFESILSHVQEKDNISRKIPKSLNNSIGSNKPEVSREVNYIF